MYTQQMDCEEKKKESGKRQARENQIKCPL